MAASKTYFSRLNYRFLPDDQSLQNNSVIFELDESDIWNTSVAHSRSPEFRKASSRISRKSAVARGGVCGGGAASLPDEYKENIREYDYDEEYSDDKVNRIPPHEFLARTRIASFSVHEGIGRTLKGRDLSRVRNAIWQKTGFQD
ncbi:hypothetical protein ACJIZ3_011333 [Penstemon smallii]|uniref:Senescence regulator S40 n=1 Tax=Penstemon smallii TaxID=265156 RepID=A0ABD3UL13_9LAMI